MLVFVDFETDDLKGEVIEACAVNENGKVMLNHKKGSVDFDGFMRTIVQKGTVIIFWHNFMPIYLSNYKPEIFNSMEGRFLTFVDFYALFDGVKKPRYSIDGITQELTGNYHKGNALSDALDLYSCYQKMR